MRIDAKPLALVLIRMISIYLIATGLSHSTMLTGNPGFWEAADTENKILVVSSFLTPLVVAILLWLMASKIAGWVSSDSRELLLPEERALVSVGTFLIGLYWAITALRAYLMLHSYGWAKSWPWLVVLALSVALILGSNLVARCYVWLRGTRSSHNKSFKERPPAAGGG